MKKKAKVTMTLGSLALVGVLAFGVYAWACDGGMPFGQGNCSQNCGSYGDLTEEQRAQIEELSKKFHDETVELRENMRSKSQELRALLEVSDPDPDEVKAVQKELSDLRGEMAQHKIDFQLEARKIAPDSKIAQGCGRGFGSQRMMRGSGKRFGPQMMMKGFGRHSGDNCDWGASENQDT
jgi:zinc resistance-associated protein